MAIPTISDLLAHQSLKTLTKEQVSSFMKYGFLRLPSAIPLLKCDEWTAHVWQRLGMSPTDKSTWTAERSNMAKLNSIPADEIAPVAWAAICELCGGEDRIAEGGRAWMDSFIVNLGSADTEGETVPPRELTNWHVDGDFFTHFLDSPEQALLVIPCWSDVEENGGATWICDLGPKIIGKILYDHPEGLGPSLQERYVPNAKTVFNHSIFHDIIQAAPDESFHEMTGKKGDVILMHPLTLHSASKNGRRLARIITNPPVSLSAPFKFNRPNPADYSLVELKTMQDLGGLAMFADWKITGERQMFLPGRSARQQEMARQEHERLREAGVPVGETPMDQTPHIMRHLLQQQQHQQQQQQQQQQQATVTAQDKL